MTVASLFAKRDEHLHIRALFFKEMDERPSTFFFSEFYASIYAPLSTAKQNLLKRRKNNSFASLKKAAEEQAFSFSGKALICADPTRDIIDYIDGRDFSMVLQFFSLSHNVFFWLFFPSFLLKSHPLSPPFFMFQVMFESRQLDNLDESVIQRVFKWDTPTLAIAHQALQTVEPAIGVLIDKAAVYGENLTRVLFLYQGAAHEEFALHTALNAPTTIQVTILSSKPAFENVGPRQDHRENIQVIESGTKKKPKTEN